MLRSSSECNTLDFTKLRELRIIHRTVGLKIVEKSSSRSGNHLFASSAATMTKSPQRVRVSNVKELRYRNYEQKLIQGRQREKRETSLKLELKC